MTLPVYLDYTRRPPCPWCDSRTGFALYYKTYSQYDCGSYYCFKCHRHGDGIKYLMEVEGMTFPEALAALNLQELAPAPDWAFKGPPLRLAHKDAELVRDAQRTLQRTQGKQGGYAQRQWERASVEVREACTDLVELQGVPFTEQVIKACALHGEIGLPDVLRNPAAIRQAQRLEAEGNSSTRRMEAWRLKKKAKERALGLYVWLMEDYLANYYVEAR